MSFAITAGSSGVAPRLWQVNGIKRFLNARVQVLSLAVFYLSEMVFWTCADGPRMAPGGLPLRKGRLLDPLPGKGGTTPNSYVVRLRSNTVLVRNTMG